MSSYVKVKVELSRINDKYKRMNISSVSSNVSISSALALYDDDILKHLSDVIGHSLMSSKLNTRDSLMLYIFIDGSEFNEYLKDKGELYNILHHNINLHHKCNIFIFHNDELIIPYTLA